MSLYDKASLVMIPSGYKDDKLFSIKPTDGSGDFTFSRDGSGASPATRVNASGYIEKGRENLLLQSNQFDTTWTTSDASVTGGQSGYDGTNNAWRLESTDPARSTIQQSIALGANSVNTLSIYGKAGNIDFLKLIIVTSGSNSIVTFDLSDGSAILQSNEIDASAEYVGADWWRLSLVASPTTNITDVIF